MLVRLLNNPLIKTQGNNGQTVPDISEIVKGGEIRDTKTLNSSCRASFGRCFAFFTLRDQLVAQQKHLLRVEESCCEMWSAGQL